MMDDSALMDAVAAGDRACFERLYSSYERRVFHYARSIVRDLGTAEEVVVDTMMAVWDGARGFSKSSRVSTWILGIARHKALDAVRRGGRAGRLGKQVALEDVAEITADEPTPDAIADSGSVRTAMQGAFAHLSAEHREILYLVFYEDLPYEDIARLLALPVNTVKTRVYYAKQNLRNHIERHTDMELLP
jgi:RNA polymerase sigma-70 factor, ECF subfamily